MTILSKSYMAYVISHIAAVILVINMEFCNINSAGLT